MIGNSEDTPEYYERLCKNLPHLAADDLRVSFTTPFPGTALFRRAKNEGLLSVEDLVEYTTEKPILHNPRMAAAEMLQWRQRITDIFYSNDMYAKRTEARVRQMPELRESYLEYFERLLISGNLEHQTKRRLRDLIAAISWAGADMVC